MWKRLSRNVASHVFAISVRRFGQDETQPQFMTEIRASVDGAAAVADVFFTRKVSPTLPCATDWLLYVAYTATCEISSSIVIATLVFHMFVSLEVTKHEKITSF